ncbi:MAG: glycosyltransferase family 39 protein [Planctomycetes bacterium]|nr:glycosyltransferase family 39 protein [Planctomycetota bacterium]MBU4398738.1 glycosyltransferase family 39 protein [Planctomycetota bacterium]MCG2683339.1 glycosyltransferase family 39 protein [Planctomycetales bacterium]
MGLLLPFQPAAADYPNHLALPRPERLRLPPAGWLLTAMVLLCLAPRAMMALRITSVCPDGVLYIHAAKAIESGNLHMAFRDLDLNTYPIILAALHRLGLDWELAAGLWGVTISSLVVLPLWGWARRQFDDRVALLACMLYAVHPKFIEWSPEVMRDPTFWMLFMLAIYWMWRAVTEVRHRYFLAAGVAIILASLTRVEGLFLLIPLVLWTFWRWRALAPAWLALGPEKVPGTFCAKHPKGRSGKRFLAPFPAFPARGKLLLGVVLCVVIFPALLLLVNIAWLHGRHGWTLLRLDPLERVQPWLEHLFGQAPADGGNSPAASMTVGRMAWVFFPTMTRGLSPIFALLMFGGIWGWRRVWSRRDHQPLFYTAVVIMCGIWIHLWYGQNICPRYALPIVLMASPLAALGLLGLVARLSRVAEWFRRRVRPDTIATVVFGVIFAANLTAAMTSSRAYFAGRRTAVDVGHWVLREFPRPTVLAGPLGVTPIVSYYAAESPYRAFRCDAKDEFILKMIENSRADVVLFRPAKQLTEDRCAALVERSRRLGMAPVRPDAMPTDEPGFIILVRATRKDLVETPLHPP